MKTLVRITFASDNIPGGNAAILDLTRGEKDAVKIIAESFVIAYLDENDERIGKLLALLNEVGEEPSISYFDSYTEEELQNAPLLLLDFWSKDLVYTGPSYGVTYDVAQACPTCHTGIRQASPLIVDGSFSPLWQKYRVKGTRYADLLVRDADVEKLIAANVTGANFWPITAKYKSGAIGEVRWQQALIENVLPPMAPSTKLVEEGICPTCSRGRKSESTTTRTPRVTYRREDLKNICDFNLSWESFGAFWDYGKVINDSTDERRPLPWTFVTPKVMNLIRGKTKKEQNNQGCNFTPIWIEDEKTGQVTLG